MRSYIVLLYIRVCFFLILLAIYMYMYNVCGPEHCRTGSNVAEADGRRCTEI